MKILSLCDYTGNLLQPWAENGHSCLAIDLQHDHVPVIKNGIVYQYGNVLDMAKTHAYLNAFDWDFIFAAPPCTDLACSGARWWEEKGIRATIESLELIEACLIICKTAKTGWMLENPVGRLAKLWRKPDLYFDPCDYGDPYTKKTCLWIGGDFKVPPAKPVEPIRSCSQGSYLQKLGGKSLRTKQIRSATPPGFSLAVYLANED